MEHFVRMHHAMKDFVSVQQVRDFSMPDVLADYRWKDFGRNVQEVNARGLAAVYFAIQIFEPASYLRGWRTSSRICSLTRTWLRPAWTG